MDRARHAAVADRYGTGIVGSIEQRPENLDPPLSQLRQARDDARRIILRQSLAEADRALVVRVDLGLVDALRFTVANRQNVSGIEIGLVAQPLARLGKREARSRSRNAQGADAAAA
jgi:hypothetical protein